MDNCLTCNAEIIQTAGKRKKLYCSALCRQKAWNKRQAIPEPEYKEGGLYRFANGGFVLIDYQKYNLQDPEKHWMTEESKQILSDISDKIADIRSTKVDVDKLAKAVKSKFVQVPPLNKEDEKATIKHPDNPRWVRKSVDSVKEDEKQEIRKVLHDQSMFGISIHKTDESGKITHVDPLSEEGEKIIKSAEKKKPEVIVPPIPVQEKGEDKFDFAARKNDWKRKYGSNH